MENNPVPGRGSLLPCSWCCSWWCRWLRGWDKNISATGSVLAPGQPQSMAGAFGVGEVAQPSPPEARQRPAGSQDCQPPIVPQKWTPIPEPSGKRGWLSPHCREGVKLLEKETSRNSALTASLRRAPAAQLTHSPLAACAHGQAGSTNWPLTYLQKGWWERQALTPAFRTVLTPRFGS